MANISPQITLPGSMYRKNKRWWWRVQLPGESSTKARALKPEGSRCATTDRKLAEEVAREMWLNARDAEAEAIIKAAIDAKAKEKDKRSTDGIARIKRESEVKLKAEIERKDKYFAEETARIKAEAEEALTKVRSEYEEELKNYSDALNRVEDDTQAETEVVQETEARLRAELEEKDAYYAGEIARVKETIEMAKAEFETQIRECHEARMRVEEEARMEAEKRTQVEEELNKVLQGQEMKGVCDCCDSEDFPVSELIRIDSGQLLCPDCLRALRG